MGILTKISLFATALRRVENVEFVRVKIDFGDASTAFGEAPATKAITGDDLGDIVNAVDTSPLKTDITISLNEKATMLCDAKEAFYMAQPLKHILIK
ncbi:hypothetical protein [Sulfurimonas sp.]